MQCSHDCMHLVFNYVAEIKPTIIEDCVRDNCPSKFHPLADDANTFENTSVRFTGIHYLSNKFLQVYDKPLLDLLSIRFEIVRSSH